MIAESMKSALGEQVVLLMQIHAPAQEAKTVEKETKTIIKHALLETEGEASARLDGTLKEINGFFKGFIVSKQVEDVHAIIAIIDNDNVLHVSHAGRAEAYVVRGGAASQITEYTRGKPTPAFVHIASGGLEPRDVLVFSTQRLLRTFTPAQLAQLVQRGDQLLDELQVALESEKEVAALSTMQVAGSGSTSAKPLPKKSTTSRKGRRSGQSAPIATVLMESLQGVGQRLGEFFTASDKVDALKSKGAGFLADLKDPKRKRRSHFLLLAGILVVFLVIWSVVNLSAYSQRSQTRAELQQVIEEIEKDIQTAENRYLTGEPDSANAILQRAEERAKQVMDNEDKLFREEAHNLLGQIRTKAEEINNIVRITPRTVVNISAENPDVVTVGMVNLEDGEFIAFDHQDVYRILLNSVENPERITDDELLTQGTYFERYKTLVFQTNGNSLIEIISDVPTNMKTEDAAGWISGVDLEAYLRFLYILSPENNQIYKYERFSNRYSAPTQYNVNGDLRNSLDMAIDGNVYILKEGGEIVKLFRGEVQQFIIRQLPEGALSTAAKLYKVFDGNLYFLDPVQSRVIVVTDGGATGEASYVRQYVLEGDIGDLQDLYVDPDETLLYVLGEKQLYAIDLK